MTKEQKLRVLGILGASTTYEVTEKSTFADLDYDSLDIIQIQNELEEEFDINITDVAMKDIKSFADISKLLAKTVF